MKIIKYILLPLIALLLLSPGCKRPTEPKPADCDPGYLPCEDDVTTCCEVICPELYHNCGEILTDCCLDSTSHSFSWSIDSLGIYGSYLNDVAIVNENDIWVVGNIETDSTSYNAAHYDGNEWELMGIYSNTLDLYSIFYFSSNDIWVTDHCSPIHWDGNDWILYHLQNMGLDVCAGNAIRGTSSSDMYFVGVNGGIVHYDGVDFVQMESGTDVDLKDITGTPDGEHVFAVGYEISGEHVNQSVVIELNLNSWQIVYSSDHTFPSDTTYGMASAVSVKGEIAYIISRAGILKYNYFTKDISLMETTPFSLYYSHVVSMSVMDQMIFSC